MFIRKRMVKTKHGETESYQALESYRENGKVKKKVLCNLGPYPTIEKALKYARERGDEERVKLLENVGSAVRSERGISKRGVSKKGEMSERGVSTKFPALRQLSPKGNLTREKKLLAKKVPGPASYDVLPPPGEGECWDKRYWKRLTFELMERKIRGVDPGGIAGVLFPHFAHHGQVGLATATLTFNLLKDKLDRSVSPDQFVMEFQAGDYQGIVSQVRRRGSQNGRAVLAEGDVIEIRRRRKEGQTLRSLGESFGVGVEAVSKICNFRTWKMV